MRLRALASVFSLAILAAISATAQIGGPPRGFNPEQASTAIAGTLYGVDGIGVSGVRVELRDSTTGAILGFTMTQSDGSFELYNMPMGHYELVAHSQGDEATEIIPPGRMVNHIELRLRRGADAAVAGDATVSIARLRVPGKARDRYDKAARAFVGNKFDQAREAVNESLAIYSDNPEALTLRGLLAWHDKNAGAAIQDFQRSIDVDPNYAFAYTAMSSVFNSQGKYDDAARATERAVAINPNAWQGYFEMSKAQLGKGLYEKALQNAKRAQDLGPQSLAAIHLLKAYAMVPLNLYKDAATELQAFLSHAPRGQDISSVKMLLAKVQAAEAAANPAATTSPTGLALH